MDLIVIQNPDKIQEWKFESYCCEQVKKIGYSPKERKLINYDSKYCGECPSCHTTLHIILDPSFTYHTEKPIKFEEPKELSKKEIKEAERRRKEIDKSDREFKKAFEEYKKRGGLF